MYTRLPVWAPSAVADPLFREVPKAVTPAEIDEIVAGYADGRRALRRGRLRRDRAAVQPLARSCAASSRPPPTGAPTTTAARSPTGPGCCSRSSPPCARSIGTRLALGVRLCGDELIEGGTTIDEAVEVARIVEAPGQVDYINTSIGVATATLFMIEASMHVPPGYALFIPVGDPQGGRPARRRRRPLQGPAAGRAGAGRGPLRPRRRRARPDRRRRLRRQGPGRRDRRHPPVPVVQPGVRRADGPEPLARAASRTPAPAASRGRRVADPARRRRRASRVLVVGGGPGRAAGRHRRGRAGPRRHGARARRPSRAARSGWRRRVPNRAELGDMVRNQVTECRRLGVTIELGVEADRRRSCGRARPTTSSWPPAPRPARPWWVGGRRHHRRATCATCCTGAAQPDG